MMYVWHLTTINKFRIIINKFRITINKFRIIINKFRIITNSPVTIFYLQLCVFRTKGCFVQIFTILIWVFIFRSIGCYRYCRNQYPIGNIYWCHDHFGIRNETYISLFRDKKNRSSNIRPRILFMETSMSFKTIFFEIKRNV